MIQRVEAGRELTQASLGDLGSALPDLVAKGVTHISIDTSRVLEFDSQTLEGVLEFDALARSRGLAVSVAQPSEVFGMALHVTGLWDRLEVRDAAPEVLAAVGRGPRVSVEPAGAEA